MRLLKLEMKRVLKTRQTIVLLCLTMLLSFVLAWLPVSFCYVSYTDANGDTVKLTGLEAARYTKNIQSDIAGTVTPEKVKQAVKKYQACLNRYGVKEIYDLPEGVYQAEIFPYEPLLRGVREAFADPETGIASSVMEITPEDIDDYYGACEAHIISLMKMEQKNHPAAQKAAVKLYDRVQKPFVFFPGYNTDAMDYQLFFSLIIVLFCTVIAAPVFTSDYQTGADDILRCTKHGRIRLAGVKIVSAFLICGIAYSLCMAIYILVSNSLFGWECTKSSIQVLYSIVNLPNMDLGQLQSALAIAELLCLLATVSFTLFLSSRCKNVVVSLSVALLFCFLPVIIYGLLPSEIGIWLYSILPSGGVGLESSFLYAAIDFQFWNIGKIAVWVPYVMISACVIEIPLFAVLAVRSYLQHRLK